MKGSSRRKFIHTTVVAASAAAVLPASLAGCSEPDEIDPGTPPFEPEGDFGFFQGVASFDPSTSAVILWTRYTAAVNEPSTISLKVEVSQSELFNELIVSESINLPPDSDQTAHIEITGLTSNASYFYRFVNELTGAVSEVGQTKTLPAAGEASDIKFAVVSCSNYEAGYFNAYEAIAESNVDFVVHLGDYIYEGHTSSHMTGRKHEPDRELLSLEEYRTRYKQYRSDAQTKAVHASKAFFCIWDDHEFADDAYKNGAGNHQPDEGDFEERISQAMQAWHEYLPCRTSDKSTIYRSIELAGIANLILLDTRIKGRDKQLDYDDYLEGNVIKDSFRTDLNDENRTILGSQQRTWLEAQIQNSTASWQILGNQVLMGKHHLPEELIPLMDEARSAGSLSSSEIAEYYDLVSELLSIKQRAIDNDPTLTEEERARVENVLPYNLDSWDGYPAEREQILNTAKGKKLISIAGASHNGWHNDLTNETGERIGGEFAGMAVTSAGLEGIFGDNSVLIAALEQANVLLMDDVNYSDAARKGYMHVTISDAEATAEWRYISSISQINKSTTTGNTVTEQ